MSRALMPDDEFDQKLGEFCPEMPEDFWPEIIVVGKYKNQELSFPITAATTVKALRKSLLGLRLSLWQAGEYKSEEALALYDAQIEAAKTGVQH